MRPLCATIARLRLLLPGVNWGRNLAVVVAHNPTTQSRQTIIRLSPVITQFEVVLSS